MGEHSTLHIVWEVLGCGGAPDQEIWHVKASDLLSKEPGRHLVGCQEGIYSGEQQCRR